MVEVVAYWWVECTVGDMDDSSVAAEGEVVESLDVRLLKGAVTVVFVAGWCPVSGRIAEGWREVTTSSEVVEVDVDLFSGLADQWKVTTVPTVLRLRNGVEKTRFIGTNCIRGSNVVKKKKK